MIASAWEDLERALKSAFMLTIFGYSAPVSDKSAIEILKSAWGSNAKRDLEQIEIIDIRNEEDLRESWEPFIHTHHYDVHSNFYSSWIAKHPRRTGEAHLNQYFECKIVSDNRIPQDRDFPDVWDWYRPLVECERNCSTLE